MINDKINIFKLAKFIIIEKVFENFLRLGLQKSEKKKNSKLLTFCFVIGNLCQ